MTRARLLVCALLASGCAPELDDRPYLLERPRLIALISEPAEARPGDVVSLEPIVVGPLTEPLRLSLSFCTAPRPLGDPRSVAEACLSEPGVALQSIDGVARGSVPLDACAHFGPDPAGSNLRPVDPDASGGFYQPIVVRGLDEPAVGRVRLHCPLPNVSLELERQLEQSYEPNHNPIIAELDLLRDGAVAPSLRVARAAAVELRVSWGDDSSESYWLPDPDHNRLQARRELLQVSWFTSGGTLRSSTTSAASTSPPSSKNVFSPDPDALPLEVWAVLSDDRGGVDVGHVTLER